MDSLGLKFRDFLNSLDKNFGTIFGQSGTGLRFGFDPGTDVFGFFCVFWYPNNLVTNRKGTKRCHVLCRSEIWVILCVIIVKYYVVVCYCFYE